MERQIGTAEKLIRNHFVGVLATCSKRGPYTTLVAFAPFKSIETIVFATLRNTRKYDNMKKNVKVSLLVDSRRNVPEDFKDASALTILGTVRESTGKERKKLAGALLLRHPHLEELVNDPDCAVMALAVQRFVLASRFQEVVEMEIKR